MGDDKVNEERGGKGAGKGEGWGEVEWGGQHL